MAGPSLRNGQKAPKSFICWSNAKIFHVCITPKNLTSETDTGSAHVLDSKNWLTAAVLLPTSPSFFLSHDCTELLPLSPFPFPSLNTGRQRQDKRRQAERWHGSPEHQPPTSTTLPNGPLHRLRETDDGRSWGKASDLSVKINRKATYSLITSSWEKENSNPHFLTLKRHQSKPQKTSPISSPLSKSLTDERLRSIIQTIHLGASFP